LGSGFLDVPHRRVEQNDGEDGDRFVRQGGVALNDPQRGRYGRGDQQQDDEYVSDLSEKPLPCRGRRLCREFVGPVELEPRPRLDVGEADRGVTLQRRDDVVNVLEVRDAHLYRVPRGDRQAVNSSRGDAPSARFVPQGVVKWGVNDADGGLSGVTN
jgi:hypothetical protein